MTPEEAIRLNRELVRTGNYDVEPKFTEALKLGIEALKRVRECRHNPRDCQITTLLPGETSEASGESG